MWMKGRFELFSRDADNATLSLMNRRNKTESAVFKRFTFISEGPLLQTILLIFNHRAYLYRNNTLLNSLNYNDKGFLFTAMSIVS